MRILPALVALAGCNTFTNVEEACLEEVPGAQHVTRPTDVELFERANCHRRVAKRSRFAVNAFVQEAVEGHRDWMELNAPRLSLFNQPPSTEGFTGTNARNRLEAAGYVQPSDSAILEVMTLVPGDAGIPTGGEYFDFWFEDPFIRPAWLQSVVYAAGAGEADYTIVYDENLGFEDEPVHLQYWNVIYQVPSQPYAEVPVAYPRDGQIDVPPDYIHLSSNEGLETGRRYGFPITFTVGSSESGLSVPQADIYGPEGAVPFVLLYGQNAATAGSLFNTAILVPDEPLSVGAEYRVEARIATDQGTRRARTTFTVGGTAREIPGGLLARSASGLPLYDARFVLADADGRLDGSPSR